MERNILNKTAFGTDALIVSEGSFVKGPGSGMGKAELKTQTQVAAEEMERSRQI